MTNGILQKNEIKNHSQPVTDIDSQVIPHIEKMKLMCLNKVGNHSGAFAIAHCQIEKDNPLRFFVLANGECIVNPEIIDTYEPFTHKEGCLSLAFRSSRKVKRFNRIQVRYTSIKDGEISTEVSGMLACIFQHEIDHFKNKYIY